MATPSVDVQAVIDKLYRSIQPAISEVYGMYQSQIAYHDELLQEAKRAVETWSECRAVGPQKRARRPRGLKGKSSLQESKNKAEAEPVMATIEEHVKTVEAEPIPPKEEASPSTSDKENTLPSTNDVANADLQATSSEPPSNKSPNKIVAKTPRQAREKLRHIGASSGKCTPGQNRALFSPYGKLSTREKAQAFEQRNESLSPTKVIPENQRTPVVVLEAQLRESCKTHEATGKEPEELPPPPSKLVQGSKKGDLQHDDVDVTDKYAFVDDCPTKEQKPIAKKGKAKKKLAPAPANAGPTKVMSAKKFTNPLKKQHARSSSSSFIVTPHTATKVVPPSPLQGARNAAGPSRLVMKLLPGSQVKQAPSDLQRKMSVGGQEREKELKLKLKAEEAKKKRESRAARVRAAKKQQEEKMMMEQQEREQKEQLKEQERKKKRKEFHQRTQSEREREIAARGGQIKRKGTSPAESNRKKVQLGPLRIKVTQQENDLAASHLLFFKPTTCLSNKVKLNNSLQQQAMLNNLSTSFRAEQQQDSSCHENVAAEEPRAPLNATYVAEQKLDSTYVIAGTSAQNAPCKTPAVNGASDKSSYDITPHHSEMPPAPSADPDNYGIDDFNSGDETDDEDVPRKVVPLWAQGRILQKHIARQYRDGWVNEDLFGELVDINLSSVFRTKRRIFDKRTSSAVWTSPIARPTQ
ncbi:inner centromere protein A-like [Ornithodoros turicata]|uniref:inner centromere protein A-like n=1 Tax=Ornithodoros turicata TaxID=34597 RepID=UPI0031398A17